MIFRGIDGQFVEMKIVNYEFPNDKKGDYYDRNWLNIFMKVDSKTGKWQTINPSLLTSEVIELINWFFSLSENENVEYTFMEFIEPNLSFELLNEFDSKTKRIRIHFDLESRPQSALEGKEYFVDCEFSENELKQISIDLNKELEKYPVR